MTLPRVNVGHVVGQVVLIADPRRRNGFEVNLISLRPLYKRDTFYEAFQPYNHLLDVLPGLKADLSVTCLRRRGFP
jgi:hypothetical protein